MGPLSDIYVIVKTRSKKLSIDFLNHFLPDRKETSDEYLIPQFSDSPISEFNNANTLMAFLESNPTFTQSIYWKNLDKESLNRFGMIFYTSDSCTIFGISQVHSGENNYKNEEDCLKEMKEFFKTEEGYIQFESPPEETYSEFMTFVKSFNNTFK